MDRECSTRMTNESCTQSFYPESIKGRDHLGVLDVSAKIILKYTLMIYGERL